MENHVVEKETEIKVETTAADVDVTTQPKIERNQIKRPRLLKQYSRVSSKSSLNNKKSESRESTTTNPLSPTFNKIHPYKCQESLNASQQHSQYFNKVLLSKPKFSNLLKNIFQTETLLSSPDYLKGKLTLD